MQLKNTRPGATIVGAGIVGLAIALTLQRDGFDVTVIDRDGPGEGATYGNAGVLATSSVVPVGTPATVRAVPRMLLDRQAPLTLRWSTLPALAPWFTRFVLASRPARVEAISRALAALAGRAIEAYAPLLRAADADVLIGRGGWLTVYESDHGLRRARGEHDLMRRRGVRFDVLRREEIGDIEPSLGPTIRHALYFPDNCWVRDTLGLARAFAAAIQRNGGNIVRDEVVGFDIGADGPRAVLGRAGSTPLDGRALIIAAGAHSGPLARALGAAVPLDTERGYHVMLPEPGFGLRLPVMHGERAFVATPMAGGIRLAGTVEFGGLAAPANFSRAEVILNHAKRIYPALRDGGGKRWMGFRPSMPDSLPVIGPCPHFKGVYFAFGHGHLGLTFAAVTGEMIGAMLNDRPPPVDPMPYRVDRF